MKDNYRIPIIIGVTGHRDLLESDTSRLSGEIKKIIEGLKEDYRNSPLYFLSPLAEGADRIAAQVAIELGLGLIVPLPMAKDEYKKDFSTNESKEEFEYLLDRAMFYFELDQGNGQLDNQEKRNDLYEELGIFISIHSQVIIALWDGKFIDKKGGTSEVVRFSTGQIPLYYEGKMCWNDNKTLTYHIPTPRLSTADEERDILLGGQGGIYGLGDNGEGVQGSKRLIKSIDDCNLELKEIYATRAKEIEKEIDQLLPVDLGGLEGLRDSPMLNAFASLSVLANKSNSTKSIFTIFNLSLVLVFFLSLFNGSQTPLIIIFAYLLNFSTIYLLSRKMNRTHISYIDYRTIAEGLRIQIFYDLFTAKAQRLKRNITDKYSTKYHDALNWVIIAIDNISFVSHRDSYGGIEEDGSFLDKLDIISKYWLWSQIEYLEANMGKRTRVGKRYVAIKKLLFTGAFLLTSLIFLLILGMNLADMGSALSGKLTSLFFVISILPAYGALVTWLTDKLAYNEEIERFRHLHNIYKKAEKSIESVLVGGGEDGIDKIRAILDNLAKEAIEENSNWALLHKDRQIDIPQ
ncbi:MAG: hypothetical protein WCZ27_05235 [Tissierellaceae bacterium]